MNVLTPSPKRSKQVFSWTLLKHSTKCHTTNFFIKFSTTGSVKRQIPGSVRFSIVAVSKLSSLGRHRGQWRPVWSHTWNSVGVDIVLLCINDITDGVNSENMHVCQWHYCLLSKLSTPADHVTLKSDLNKRVYRTSTWDSVFKVTRRAILLVNYRQEDTIDLRLIITWCYHLHNFVVTHQQWEDHTHLA